MGAPKQKWNPEEEAALKAGVLKHGPGKWRTILKDPQFSGVLYLRSNVDLKDKWRNMSVMANGWGSRERAKLALATTRSTPRYRDGSKAHANASQSDEEMADAKTNTASGSSSPNDGSNRSIMRLDNLIVEAINNLREPGGSNRASIAAYIEDQYWAPPNFKRILSSKLKHLAAMGKLDKMNRKYRIRSTSALPEKGQNPTTPVQEGRQRIPQRTNGDDINNPMETETDLELARMRSMTPQEAAAAAAKAVAEAEIAIAEAEEAEREAEAAEAEAEAAEAFAEAARKTMKGRNGSTTGTCNVLVKP